MDHRKVQNKEVIRQQLAASRQAISSRADSFIEEINIVSKFRRSFNNNPALWTVGAFLGATLLVKILTPAKRQQIILEHPGKTEAPTTSGLQSRARSLFSLGIGFAMPYLKQWVATTAKDKLIVLRDRFFPSDTHH